MLARARQWIAHCGLRGRLVSGAAALVALLATAWFLPPPAAAQGPDRRPNIILITAEDLSPRLGSYGDPVARTPNIDALAREGIRFTRVFTAAPVCAPSRAALITGVHNQTLGTMHMRASSFGGETGEGTPYEAVPPAEVKAFPELLRAAGYYTVNRAKTDYQFGDPFSVWDENGRTANWSARADGQPFFAMINFGEAHESRTWPPGSVGTEPTLPEVMRQNARIDANKTLPLTDPARVVVPPFFPDTPVTRANLARHYDNIAVMDQRVGALLAELKRAGRFEDSIIIFTTDHGDGLPRYKRSLYDTGLHVPLIVRYPDRRDAGSTRDELVSFIDLAPTFLKLAGAPTPAWIQGRDFLGQHVPRTMIYAASDRYGVTTQRRKYVRDHRYAYVRNDITDQASLALSGYQDLNPIMAEWRRLDAGGGLTPLQRSYLHAPIPAEELYDTAADPYQVRNLAADPAQRPRLVAMRAGLAAWIARTGDLTAIAEAEMVAHMWPGGVQPVTATPTACSTGDVIYLTSATPGASLGWRGTGGAWRLYTAPTAGIAEAKAIRYGYRESAVLTIPATVPDCATAEARLKPD